MLGSLGRCGGLSVARPRELMCPGSALHTVGAGVSRAAGALASSGLVTGGVCWDMSPNSGLWLGGAGGVCGGLCRPRAGDRLGGVDWGCAGGCERSSWAAASAERRAA